MEFSPRQEERASLHTKFSGAEQRCRWLEERYREDKARLQEGISSYRLFVGEVQGGKGVKIVCFACEINIWGILRLRKQTEQPADFFAIKRFDHFGLLVSRNRSHEKGQILFCDKLQFFTDLGVYRDGICFDGGLLQVLSNLRSILRPRASDAPPPVAMGITFVYGEFLRCIIKLPQTDHTSGPARSAHLFLACMEPGPCFRSLSRASPSCLFICRSPASPRNAHGVQAP